jgi:hypothetical protein
MALALGNVSEAIGGALLPFFTTFSEKVIAFTPFLEQNANMFLKVGAAIAVVAISVKTLQLGISAVSLAIQVATGVTALFNAVLNANPISLIVIAIAALVAGLVIAYNKFEPFKNLIDQLWEVMKGLGNFIKNVFVGYFELWLKVINKIKDAITGLGNAIADSSIGKAIGGLIGGISGSKAAGGSVSAGQSYRVGEFGSEIFTPNSSGVIRRDNGGGGNTFVFNGVVDGESARRSIERVMQNSTLRTGQVNLAGSAL